MGIKDHSKTQLWMKEELLQGDDVLK